MTETLSAEDIKRLNSSCEIAFNQDDQSEHDVKNSFSAYTMQRALNTIEAKDQEIEALKGQVTALADICDTAVKWWQEDIDGTPKGCASYPALLEEQAMFQKGITDTQATAEAFIAKERADEREKAIRECAQLAYYNCREENNFRMRDMVLSLLTKEQA